MPDTFDVSIDRYRLDEEWMGQPGFYHEFAEKLADARQALDEAKNQQEVVRAETLLAMAKEPKKFGLLKTTDETLKNAVTANKRYQEAVAIVIQAKHVVAIFEAAVSALDQRKKALEKLVDLHVTDYHSQPKSRKGDASTYVEDGRRQSFQRRTSRRREDVQ